VPRCHRCRGASWRSSATSSGRAGLAAVALLALALACAAPPGHAPAPQDAAYDNAVALAASDAAAGEAALVAYLRANPDAERFGDAALELARLRVERGNAKGAARSLQSALRAQPRGPRVDSIRLALARLERDAGRMDDAYRVASAIRPSRLPQEERAEAYRLLAQAAGARGDRAGQLRWLGQLAASTRSGVQREAALREIDAVVAGLTTPELVDLADRLGKAPPADRVWLRLAERQLAGGDVAGAEEALARARDLTPSRKADPAGEALAARVRARREAGPLMGPLPEFSEVARLQAPEIAGARGTLGLVLPLSGPFARYGDACLRGAMLAADIFGAGEGGLRLRVRDSGGDPATAAVAVADLAADPEVVAVVGPLLSDPSEAAADAAEAAGVPLLALTPRERVAAERSYAFRLALTPRAEVDAVAGHAVGNLGAARFAILHPRDAYGRGLKNLFWDAVEARGGQVVGVARYDPDATDFREPIRRLAGYLLLDDEQKEALRERKKLQNRAKRVGLEEAALLREEAAAVTGPDEEPLPPIVDFDALFIADAHEKVALIAPQLAFHEVQEVQLLGPSGWNHPDLLSVGGRHLEGAIFAESFFGDSRFPFVREFRDRYVAAFGEAPDVLAAQTFDATNLVLVQLARGLTTRTEVREGLLTVRGHPGVSGITSIQPDGNALKRPFLLSVQDGEIVSLD